MLDIAIFEKIAGYASNIFFHYNCIHNQLTYISPNYLDIWEREILPLQDLITTIKKEDRAFVTSMLEQLKEEAFSDVLEFSIILPDNSFKKISAHVSSLLNEAGEIAWIGGFLQDVTQAKKLESSMLEYGAKKNSLLEIIEHDLGGHMKMLQQIAASFTDENVQNNTIKLLTYAKSIQELSKATIDMISDLVKKELIDSVETPLQKIRIEIVQRIESFMSIFKSSESLIHKTFKLKANKQEIYVEVDDVKLMQVFNNLIYNAIKFTPENGTIAVNVEEKEKTLLVEIADNGIWIPKQFYEQLFEVHSPAARIGIKGEKTSGIGLSIVKRIVELHRGKIWFNSEEGKGTSFFVEIPKR